MLLLLCVKTPPFLSFLYLFQIAFMQKNVKYLSLVVSIKPVFLMVIHFAFFKIVNSLPFSRRDRTPNKTGNTQNLTKKDLCETHRRYNFQKFLLVLWFADGIQLLVSLS